MSRIRANLITNQSADGSPTVQDGLVISGVTTSTSFSGSGASLTNLNASNIASGTVPTARLGSGTANSSTFLAGDSTFKTVTGTTINNNADNRLITGSGTANTLNGEANLIFDGTDLGLGDSPNNIGSLRTFHIKGPSGQGAGIRLQDDGDTADSDDFTIYKNYAAGYLRINGTDPLIAYMNGAERFRINSSGNIGVAGETGTDFSLLDGMVINTGNGNAGLLINSSSSSHNAYLGFSYGSGSSTSHADQYSAYIGRVGDNTLVLGTNNSTRVYVTSDGDVAIGRDAALNNYAAGSTTTQLAVVKDGGAAGSGYHEVAHFTGGTDSDDTGAIVRITQFNNDRGLYIKGGRGTGDQAKAIFGLRNSANSDSDVMIFEQGGRVTIPGQPSFAAYKAANSFTQSGVIVFDATKHNIGGHYSTSTGKFTAPVAGRYQFTFWSIVLGQYSSAYYSIRKNGSAGRGMYVHLTQTHNGWDNTCTTWILDLNENDYVDLDSNSSINWHGNDWQLFSGQLLS